MYQYREKSWVVYVRMKKYLQLSALNAALQDQNLAWGGDEGSSNVVHSNWLWLCFFFLHYWEGQVFAVLLPVCTFYHKWHYLSKYISGCHTTQWIPRLSSYYVVGRLCLLQAAHESLPALYTWSSVQQFLRIKFLQLVAAKITPSVMFGWNKRENLV